MEELLAAVRQNRQGSDFQHLRAGWGWVDGELLARGLRAIVEDRWGSIYAVTIHVEFQRLFRDSVESDPFVQRRLNSCNCRDGAGFIHFRPMQRSISKFRVVLCVQIRSGGV